MNDFYYIRTKPMRTKIEYKYTHKFHGFLKKHTKMWWKKTKKEFVKNNIHPKVLYYGPSGIVEWTLKECPLIRFGAWLTNKIDNFTLFAEWEDGIDKFKPSQCAFNFSNVEEMINEAIVMTNAYKAGGETLNNYILKNNSFYITEEDDDEDMLALLNEEHEMRRHNGMSQEEWDKAFEKRKDVIKEAVADENIWGVVVVPRMQFFYNIPETLFIAIEDEEEKISEDDWNKAWEKWDKIMNEISYNGNFDITIVPKHKLLMYANINRYRRRKFKTAHWQKGNFIKLKNK